jgi:hypothetical protein
MAAEVDREPLKGMAVSTHSALALAIAIGIGLLIGAERERRKGSGSRRGSAGIRTFALAAFAGALSRYLNSQALLVAVAAAAVLFSAIAYRRGARKDPGLTTEFALLVTVLLGALTMQVVAFVSGGYRFATRVLPGLIVVVSAGFIGAWLGTR